MDRIVEKKRIGRGFHRQAGEYDQHAVVQKRVVANLERLIEAHCNYSPRRLLDIGCGTGALISRLHKRFQDSELVGLDLAYNMALKSSERLDSRASFVNGDAEQLPFRDGAFDLVVSASTLQWVEKLDNVFAECCRLLAPGGIFCAAFFGGRTLWEMQDSYRKALSDFGDHAASYSGRLKRFKDAAEAQAALAGLDFEQLFVATETEIEYHPDVPELLRSIKAIGASTAASGPSAGLGWRRILQGMAGYYRENFRRDGLIPATYEVVYLVARKKNG